MAKDKSGIPKVAQIILVFVALFFLLALYFDLPNLGYNVTLPQIGESTPITYYKVTKVIDGDTLQLDINGNSEKVRLVGINTPEIVDPNKPVECYGKEASQRMEELADGQLVHIEFDNSQSIRDIYGRFLAYVYLQDGQMLNRKMVAEGYAYEYTYMTPYEYQKEFRGLQQFARNQGRGLWGPSTCSGNKILIK